MNGKNQTIFLTEYPNRGTFVTLVFNFYVLAWWLEVGKRIALLGQIRFEFLLAAFLCIVVLVRPEKILPSDIAGQKIVKGIIFYFLVILFSLMVSQDFSLSLNIIINRVFKFAAMTMFMSFFVRSPQALWYFLISTFIAFLKVGQETFLGKITGSLVWENQGIMRLHGPTATMFGDPNSLSGKTVSIIPYLWFIFGIVNKYWKALIIIQVIFAINIIVFSGSRTGYVATCILMLVFWWCSRKKWKMLLGLVAVILMLIALSPAQYKARFMSSFEGREAEGHSKRTRIELLHDSLTVFKEYPFGVGPGCFMVMQERAGRDPQGTHNLYTQILTEIGIQGFVAFSYFIYTIVHSLLITREKASKCLHELSLAGKQLNHRDDYLHNLLNSEKKKVEMLHAVCVGTLVFLFTRGILGCLGHDLYEIYWWIAAGLSLSLSNIQIVAGKRSEELINYCTQLS